MTGVLRRTLTVFFGVLLVVVLTYTGLEITAINETEEEVTEVYQDQLSAILFSINQYSQDVVSSWIADITPLTQQTSHKMAEASLEYLEDHPSIEMIFQVDTTLTHFSFSHKVDKEGISQITSMLSNNKEQIDKLIVYLAGGYQKLEPMLDDEGLSYLVFVSKQNEQTVIMGVLINPSTFISEVLSPRLQIIGREEIILSAYSKVQDTVVYTTRPDKLNEDEVITTTESNLWLFPTHYLGVSFMDQTLNDLVEDRTRNNLIMLGLINLVLIVGIIVIVRTVDKQLKLAKMKSDFVSNVSHEIRTPLALISMYAETLEMNRVKNDEERHQFYHIILSETKRLTGLVNRILKFSKLEAGKQSYNFAATNLNDIVDDTISTFEFHLKEGGFTLNRKQAELPEINADAEAVATAVFNLLDNAIKYSGDNRQIELETYSQNDEIIVKVTDHGLGIPNSERKHIFEKFYRVEDPLIHNTKGSGLGLNLVFEIMHDHGGRVEVSSKVGEGSAFELIFPVNHQEP